MPFDGVVVKCVVNELNERIAGCRIEKIFQPERDEIIINIRADRQNLKLLLSANPSYPRIHITEKSKENPITPPVFCMLLRKHLSGGRIINIEFHDYERIVTINTECLNEMGDVSTKKLIIEIMGRHSNIILVNSENKIIDSIKHIDQEISSVREVMPARPYVLPPPQQKTSPDIININELCNTYVNNNETSVGKHLLNNIKGFSPLVCREICCRSGIDEKTPVSQIQTNMMMNLKKNIEKLINDIKLCSFTPCIIFKDENKQNPFDFHCLSIRQYRHIVYMPSANVMLDMFYSAKDKSERLKQKKSNLFKVINTSIKRCNKKLAIYEEKLRDAADSEKHKLFGELITANIHCIPKNSKSVSLQNYYSETGEYVEIPLNNNLLPQENAQKYFKLYAKSKSASLSAKKQIKQTQDELAYLESVEHNLQNCTAIKEIEEIRQELTDQGYLKSKKKKSKSGQHKPLGPLRYKSSDGLDIFVGRNNKQNDMLTLKSSSSNDIWLHTKNIPGSHVIIKKIQHEISEKTIMEAAMLAAYNSKAKMSSNVPVDYTTVKNVKKPNGAKPGMVIYNNFNTIAVTPDEDIVKKMVAHKEIT